MKKARMTYKKLLSLLLSCILVLQLLPTSVSALAVRQEWIAEFADSATAQTWAEQAGGTYLGGPFALLRATKAELEDYPILSLTENAKMEGSSVSQPSDPKASEQYILTHKSWYAKDAWAALESFLGSQSTALTPAQCATVRVAVLDSGIDATHEDLSGRVTAGWDAVNRTAIAAGTNSDVSADSHGTKVAGLIGAASDNGIGMAGAAWTFPVELIPVRVLGSTNKGSIADIVAAIYWAVDEGNADILNLSFGQNLRSVPSAMQTAVLHAVEQGVIVVAAAGNDDAYYKSDSFSYRPYYPAALDGVLPVGSTARALYNNSYVQKAEFSNYPSYEGDCGKTFFYTPGEDLLTTSTGNTYEEFSGTSASAALLSGMLAAMKSCADTTGRPQVENYLSYCKYSYLGALYYQDYKAMADALVYGYTAGSARFEFDSHIPRTVKGTAQLPGILYDPGFAYTELRLYIDGTLVDTVARNELARQPITFTVDTTAVADGDYYPYQLDVMGVMENGTEVELDHTQSITVSNNTETCTVTVTSGGAPLVGAECWIYHGSESYAYSTDTQGQIALSLSDADGTGSIFVLGQDLLVCRKLTPYPAGNRYSFGSDPALLTIRCSGETLAAAEGATIYVAGPNGDSYPVGTVTGGETKLWVDTDASLTFTICSAGAILTQTLDLSGNDVVWDLDSMETATVTLTHDGKAPEGEDSAGVRFLGLQIGGYGKQLLNPEGGSVLVTPGRYSFTGFVYWRDGNYYSDYIEVNFGARDVSLEGLELTLGSGTPTADFTFSPAAPTEGQNVTFTVGIADSCGNPITELGSSDDKCLENSPYSGVNLDVESYDAENEQWVYLTSAYLNSLPGTTTVPGAYIGTEPGKRRVCLPMEQFFEGAENITAEFTIAPQETRPAAAVHITLQDANENTVYYPCAAALLMDAEGNTIVREAYSASYGQEALIKLPIGQSYTLAVLAVDYSQAYMTTCQVDLSQAADGEEVQLTVSADTWTTHEIPAFETETGYYLVRNLSYAPFTQVPDYRLAGMATNGHIETLYTAGLSQQELYLDVVLDSYEMECYEFPPVFTMTKQAELSQDSTLEVGSPENLTLTAQAQGSSVTLTPMITDAYGNRMVTATYVSRYGSEMGGEMGGGSDMTMPVMVDPVITVYNGDAEAVFTKSTAFAPVTLEGLPDGAYAAILEWNSSDIHLTGEQVDFTIGTGGGEAPPVIPALQVPTAFRAAVSDGAVTLTWQAPANGCVSYELLRDGVLLARLGGDSLSYTDASVTGGSYYMYTLYAIDEAGRRSEAVTAGAAISAGADTQPPLWGSDARLTAQVGDGGVNLSWSRAQDTLSGVASYLLYCNDEEVAQLFTRSYTYAAVLPDTDYVFSVKAVDGAGNVSEALTAQAVRVSSGILGVSLNYETNRLGYMTGKTIAISIKTTADLTQAAVTVDYTHADGTGTLTPQVTGEAGSYLATLTMPDDFRQIDQIRVTAGSAQHTCLAAPIVRCAAHVLVTVDLSEAAALYPNAVLTLYAPNVGYAYSFPIQNMAGTVETDVIADRAYQLTLADSEGTVLLQRTADLSADAQVTLGAEDAHFLQLTVEGGYAGLAVTVTSDGRLVSGKLDESGTAIWSSGGRFLAVGTTGTLRISELNYTQELTFDKVVNQITVQPESLGYEIRTIPVTVVDGEGQGVSGIEVRIAGYNVVETKTTGPDGTCVFTFANRKDNVPMVSMQQQRDDQGRIWTYLSIPVYGSEARLEPTQMYDKLVIRPVLGLDVQLQSISYSVNGQPVQLKDGLLTVTATDTLWRKNQLFTVTATCTADGLTYSGKGNGWLDPELSEQVVKLEFSKHVDVTVSLTDNGDVLTGTARYFAIYDLQDNLVTSLRTYASEVTVTLVDGEIYYVAGSWDPIGQRWMGDPCVARATITARDGLQVSLSRTRSNIASLLFSESFFLHNGILSHTVSPDAEGNIVVAVRMNHFPVQSPDLTKVYNELVLPAGVQSVSYVGSDFTYDPDTGIVRILTDLTKLAINNMGTVYITFAADQMDPDPQILHDLVFTYGDNEYRTRDEQLDLNNKLMAVRLVRTTLMNSAVTARVCIPCAQAGILEVYDGDTLLASCATKEQQKTYQLQVSLPAMLGERDLRVVYTGDNGLQLTQTVTIEIVDESRPTLLSAKYTIDGKTQGDLMDARDDLYYSAGLATMVTCLATFTNPEMVDQVWLCGETESEFDRVKLHWDQEKEGFYGVGQLGELADPFSAMWIEFTENLPTEEDLDNVVYGELTLEYPLTFTPAENSNSPYSYTPDPDLGEAVQAQAFSDWEKYVQLVNGGLYEQEDEGAVIAAMEELFGEDQVWHLPAVTDGEHNFSMSYTYDPERIAQKLKSKEAFTVTVNGEKRKVLIEFTEENGDLYICYYGMGDVFIPAAPESGEPDMAAAGSILSGLRDFVKRHWEDGMEIKQKYDDYGWIGEGLVEELQKDPEGEEDGAKDTGDPCNSGTGGQTREQRRQQVDEMFDEGWEASKAVAEGISMTGGFMGLESSVLGEFITQDGGAVHALFEMQKQRIHQIDDILDEADEGAFADGTADPCKEEEPQQGKETSKPKEHPKLGYQPIWPLIDPSGYLYAGAPGYPATGVNAYLYYLEKDGLTWTLWNSADYGQGPNPYPSASDGYYGWDVLPGKWKVVFEGEGYARAESTVLEVPPPHMDVDIAMTSTRNPKLVDASVHADGSIYLKFDHLMTTESVLGSAVTVVLGSQALSGTLLPVDETETAIGTKQADLSTNVQPGVKVASVFRFIPDDPVMAGMTLEITVDSSVLGYNGLPMLSTWSDRLTVPQQDADLTLQTVERIRTEGIYLPMGGSYTLSSTDWRAVYADSFGATQARNDIAIRWRSTDEAVILVDETGKITAVGSGIASAIGEYQGHTLVFGVSVARAPISAKAEDNDVRFCRDLNLVLGKACYMWSAAANYQLEDPTEGDEKYLPTAWRVKEAGAVQAQGVVAEGGSSLKIIYTPTTLGTLTGEIDYQKYVYTSGRWVATGSPETAVRQIPVTEVTGLTLHTAPKAATPGQALDLSAMRISIAMSDGTVSTVAHEKLASYGITLDKAHGDILSEGETALLLTHGRTGITLTVSLTGSEHIYADGICTHCGIYQAAVLQGEAYELGNPGQLLWYAAQETAYPARLTANIALAEGQTVSFPGDVHLDLNGFSLSGSVSAGGTFYCHDNSATATAAGTGHLAVSGDVAKDHTAGGVRYIALAENGGYTFHVLHMATTDINLRAREAGIYYQARITCDPVLAAQVKCYGVALSLKNMPGSDFMQLFPSTSVYTMTQGAPVIGQAFTSVAVFNIFKEGAANAERGSMEIYSNTYLKLNDGTLLLEDVTTGDTVNDEGFDGIAWSLRDVMVALDSRYSQLSETDQATVRSFYTTWKEAMTTWGLTNLEEATQ